MAIRHDLCWNLDGACNTGLQIELNGMGATTTVDSELYVDAMQLASATAEMHAHASHDLWIGSRTGPEAVAR